MKLVCYGIRSRGDSNYLYYVFKKPDQVLGFDGFLPFLDCNLTGQDSLHLVDQNQVPVDHFCAPENYAKTLQ